MQFSEATKNDPSMELQIISPEGLDKIHQGALYILENTGIVIDDNEAKDLLKKEGATLHEKNIVKIPAKIIDKALSTLPRTFHATGRGGKDFSFGDGKVRFTSFGESPQIIDPKTGEVRNVTVKDVENYARVVDALPAHDMCWDAWVPTDVPAETYCLHTLKAYLENTTKFVTAAAVDGVTAAAVVEMMTAVAGSQEELRKNPIGMAGTCPKSPLYLDKGTCESTITLARGGVPIINTSALTAGGTGPVTLAGTIAIHHAEMLANITLSQLAYPGSIFVYGCCTTALDLRKGTSTFGCPEIGMCSAALSKLCQKYQIPHVVAGFWTDSKVSDLQCGHEKTLNGILPALAGADMIFGTAGLAAGMSGSYAQLVADDEMIANLRRVMAGIPVEDIDLALDLIDKVGPQGNFLSEEHTVMNMRRSQIYPKYGDRAMVHEWISAGSKTMADNAETKANELLTEYQPQPMDEALKEKLAEIIFKTEQSLGLN